MHDQYYVDGVTLTYGSPGSRQHIWTFATGIAETHNEYACRCSPDGTGVYNAIPPPFVGNDYFCETGHPGTWAGSADIYIIYIYNFPSHISYLYLVRLY